MTDRSPGEPLNPTQVAGVADALPVDTLYISSHVMNVGGGHYAMNIPVVVPMQVDHANYQSHDVPFIPLKADYRP